MPDGEIKGKANEFSADRADRMCNVVLAALKAEIALHEYKGGLEIFVGLIMAADVVLKSAPPRKPRALLILAAALRVFLEGVATEAFNSEEKPINSGGDGVH